MTSDYITVAEIATELRVSRMTVYRLLNEGTIPSIRVGRGFRVARDKFDQYLADVAPKPHTDQPPPPLGSSVAIVNGQLATYRGLLIVATDPYEWDRLPGQPIPFAGNWISVTDWLLAQGFDPQDIPGREAAQ